MTPLPLVRIRQRASSRNQDSLDVFVTYQSNKANNANCQDN